MPIEYLADRPELIPELARWHLAQWGGLHPGQTLETRIAALRSCCGRRAVPSALIATDGAALIGSALLVEHDMSTRPDLAPWLAGVFVKPEHRCAGVASRLIEAVEALARELHVQRLYLYTDAQAAFYGRRGWAELEQCRYRGLDVTVMSKTIAAAAP